MNYLSILTAYFSIGRIVYGKNKRLTKELLHQLEKDLSLDSNVFDKKTRERIFYYTLQCCIVSQWACSLRGYALTEEEFQLVVELGALTPLIDDLTDEFQLTTASIEESLNSEIEPKTSMAKVARHLYRSLESKKGSKFNQQFHEVLIAQEKSLKQVQKKALSREEILEITKQKGAMSIILYREILSNPLIEGEKKAFMEMGYATQLINDQFDVFKDFKNNVQSSYTIASSWQKEREEYLNQSQLVFQCFSKLNFPRKNRDRCLAEISTILARGLVCLDQLLELEKRNEGQLELGKFSRKDLICDMEKPRNILQSIQFSYRLLNADEHELMNLLD